LLELPRELSQAELAGGFPVHQFESSFRPMEEHYTRRIRALPQPTQNLLLLAAADPTGDATLGLRRRPSGAVAQDRRSRALPPSARSVGRLCRRSPGTIVVRRTHSALAAATDVEVDPERRVWHLAAAATGLVEAIALQLEETAIAAQARAGSAAAAAFLERAVELTAQPERRSERALTAAHAHMNAGAFESAQALLAEAQGVATGDLQHARIERLRARSSLRPHQEPRRHFSWFEPQRLSSHSTST
jgi:hypothetical protein